MSVLEQTPTKSPEQLQAPASTADFFYSGSLAELTIGILQTNAELWPDGMARVGQFFIDDHGAMHQRDPRHTPDFRGQVVEIASLATGYNQDELIWECRSHNTGQKVTTVVQLRHGLNGDYLGFEELFYCNGKSAAERQLTDQETADWIEVMAAYFADKPHQEQIDHLNAQRKIVSQALAALALDDPYPMQVTVPDENRQPHQVITFLEKKDVEARAKERKRLETMLVALMLKNTSPLINHTI